MPSAAHGFQRVFEIGVAGLAPYLIISQLLTAFGYSHAIILLNVVSIVAIIALFDKMIYWSIPYLVGWIFGLLTLGSSLFSFWELAIYIPIAFLSLGMKFQNKFGLGLS